ncbi:hypothetical protein GQ53DRAFT_110534 [Thozetella sp. PMI_491]|nr:hypothetical protein GQ53DRAFT_110534 [Thozetella sp. PMI_491]
MLLARPSQTCETLDIGSTACGSRKSAGQSGDLGRDARPGRDCINCCYWHSLPRPPPGARTNVVLDAGPAVGWPWRGGVGGKPKGRRHGQTGRGNLGKVPTWSEGSEGRGSREIETAPNPQIIPRLSKSAVPSWAKGRWKVQPWAGEVRAGTTISTKHLRSRSLRQWPAQGARTQRASTLSTPLAVKGGLTAP